MKKTVLLFLAIFMCFILIACDSQDNATITCVNCGEKNATTAKFCQSCGKAVSSSNNKEDTTDTKEDGSNSNTDTQKPHEHSFKSTVTEPTCTATGYTTYTCECGTTYKDDYTDAAGHKWNEATCITPKMCPVCKATEGEAEGHTFENGECIYCNEDDPNYVALTLTSTKYNINLEENSDVAYITMIGGESVTYNIDDTSVVNCEWGDWDDDIIPLTFIPVSSGNTVVTVYIEGYDKSITINVSVELPESTLTIEGVGKEYNTYYTGAAYGDVQFLHSAEYSITNQSNNKIWIEVEVIAETIENNVINKHYIGIEYELYNENDVCVETGNIWIDANYSHRKYSQIIQFYVASGNYTLIFKDMYV